MGFVICARRAIAGVPDVYCKSRSFTAKEGTVFNFMDQKIKELGVALLLTVAAGAITAGGANAGLLDGKPFSRSAAPKVKPAATKQKSAVIHAGFSDAANEPRDVVPISEAGFVGGGYPSAPYYDMERPEPAMKLRCEKTFDCFNCGDNDHRQECRRCSNKHFGSTWYPRVAPYCETGWGWTQPCWRRTEDNYNCPKILAPKSSAPSAPAPAPAAPGDDSSVSEPVLDGNPVPEMPPVPRDSPPE
jgi:hypothetical protein